MKRIGMMKVIYNNYLPVKGFRAINLFGVVFVRRDSVKCFPPIVENHEAIHTAQMKELGYVFFYLIYFFEWLFRLVFHTATAYRGITFEQEAYGHQGDLEYLETRKHYAQWRK